MNFEPHPLRGTVLREVHARSFAAIDAPSHVIHFALMTDIEHADSDRAAFTSFCEARGQRGPDVQSKYHKIELAD